MSASDNARAFFTEIGASHEVWGVEYDDERAIDPVWHPADDYAVRPFWSSRRRVEEMLAGPLSGRQLRAGVVPAKRFIKKVLPAMRDSGQLCGINWAGPQARGHNRAPEEVIEMLKLALKGKLA